MAARRDGGRGTRRGAATATRAGGAAQAPSPRRGTIARAGAVCVGRVEHFYPRAAAATVRLRGALAVGDWIHVRGRTTDLVLAVEALRRAGRRIQRAHAGELVGLPVRERLRAGDRVYRVVP